MFLTLQVASIDDKADFRAVNEAIKSKEERDRVARRDMAATLSHRSGQGKHSYLAYHPTIFGCSATARATPVSLGNSANTVLGTWSTDPEANHLWAI